MARAISEAAKAEKENIILDKALELFLTQSYSTLKMIDIANACGFSKGTIFYYFGTKEKLFLKLQIRESKIMYNKLYQKIEKSRNLTLDSLFSLHIEELARQLDDTSPFVRLSALLSTLEESLDFETALEFKQMSYSMVIEISQLIAEKVSAITIDDCTKMFMAQQAMITGYKSLSSPPEVLKKVVKEYQMSVFDVDFKSSILQAMKYYLDGLKRECLERAATQ